MKAMHKRDPRVESWSLEQISRKYVARFADRKPDWHAFADASIEGWKRATLRYIGATSSGKPITDEVVPAGAFGMSVMFVPPGQGNASHTHEAEEIFFVLRGHLMVFYEDEDGKRLETTLGQWDLACCPAGVIHGYHNNSLEPVYLIVSVGKARPDFMAYADPKLYEQRDAHLKKTTAAKS